MEQKRWKPRDSQCNYTVQFNAAYIFAVVRKCAPRMICFVHTVGTTKKLKMFSAVCSVAVKTEKKWTNYISSNAGGQFEERREGRYVCAIWKKKKGPRSKSAVPGQLTRWKKKTGLKLTLVNETSNESADKDGHVSFMVSKQRSCAPFYSEENTLVAYIPLPSILQANLLCSVGSSTHCSSMGHGCKPEFFQ